MVIFSGNEALLPLKKEKRPEKVPPIPFKTPKYLSLKIPVKNKAKIVKISSTANIILTLIFS